MDMIVGNNRNGLRGPLAVGCAAVLLLALSPAASAGGATIERPLKGTCDTTFEQIGVEPTTPPVQVLEITLDCNLSHMGRVSGVAIQRVTLQPPPFPITTEIVYEAANGDLLNARFTGFAVPTNADGSAVEFAGVTVYAGGTGRFAQATGSSQDTGTASLVTSTGTIQVRGKIVY
jgi:hypothetical protein